MLRDDDARTRYHFSSLRVWLTHSGDCPKAEVEHEVLREDGSDVSLGSQDGGAAFVRSPRPWLTDVSPGGSRAVGFVQLDRSTKNQYSH